LLEGIPLNSVNGLFWGVLVHKFTIALALSLLLLESKVPKYLSLLAMGLFSLMTPLGSFLSGQSLWPEHWNNYLNALAVGILLHIATVILFESSDGHRFNWRKFAIILGGFALGYLVG
jgi:zinc transporter ZupT